MENETNEEAEASIEVPSSLLVQSIEESFERVAVTPPRLGIIPLPIGGDLTGVTRIIIVRIISPNPMRIRITHQSITVPAQNSESDNLARIKQEVRSNRNPEVRGPYRDLGLPIKTRFDMDITEQASPCLLAFHCETRRSNFLHPQSLPPVEGGLAPFALLGDATNTADIMEQAKYAFVDGNDAPRTVVALCKPDPNRGIFKYGIGLRIGERRNSAAASGVFTDVIIDPKVRNNG